LSNLPGGVDDSASLDANGGTAVTDLGSKVLVTRPICP
jgi:hypothetical protein